MLEKDAQFFPKVAIAVLLKNDIFGQFFVGKFVAETFQK